MTLMIPRRSILPAALVMVTLSAPQADDAWVVRFDGVGPVKVGMTLHQLNVVLHEKFSIPADKEEQSCFYADTANYPQVAFMIENGSSSRVDVLKPGIATAEGVQVGDSEVRAHRVYGSKLRTEPHTYDPEEGRYLTFQSMDGRFGIRFETEKGKIQMFYAGRFKSVQYIEGF